MKILSVRAKNIASLKGEVYVDFSRKQYIDAGIFAITGKTGAGKTSLLDAITVALYGYTPRCHKNTPEDIMSRFTGEAWSEVEFEVRERRYRCRWGIHRSRKQLDGALQSPKMEIVDLLTGNILEEKLTEVRNKVEEITGLDYEKFLQTVMLSQGEFAKFLKASSKEKSALLEKITGSVIYSELSQLAHQKEKEEREKLQSLKKEIDESKLLNPEQVEEIQQKIKECSLKQGVLIQKEEEIHQQLGWLNQISQKRNELEVCHAKRTAIKTEEEQIVPELQKLALHQKASPFQSNLVQVESLQKDYELARESLSTIDTLLPQLKESSESALVQFNMSKEKHQADDQKLKEALPQIRSALGLENERDRLREKYKSLEKKILEEKTFVSSRGQALNDLKNKLGLLSNEKSICAEYLAQYQKDEGLVRDYSAIATDLKNYSAVLNDIDHHHTSLKGSQSQKGKTEQELEQKSKDLKEIESSLKNFMEAGVLEEQKLQKLLMGKDIQVIRDNLEQLLKTGPLLQDIKRIHGVYKLNKEKQEKYGQDIAGLEIMLEKDRENSEVLQKRLGEQEQVLHAYEELYDKELMIQSLVDHRANLKENEPCPLCGAVEHPFAEYNSEKKISEAGLRKQAQEKLVAELQGQQKDHQKKESVHLNNLEHYRSGAKELQDQDGELLAEFARVCQKVQMTFDILDIQSIENKLDATSQDIIVHKAIIKEFDILNQHKADLADKIQKSKELHEATGKLLHEKKTALLLLNTKMEQLEAEVVKSTKGKDVLLTGLNEVLRKYDLDVPDPANLVPWLEYVHTRAEKYSTTIATINRLDLEIESVKSDLRVAEESISGRVNIIEELEQDQKKVKEEGVSLARKIQELVGNRSANEYELELNMVLEKSLKEKEHADMVLRKAEAAYSEKSTERKSALSLMENRSVHYKKAHESLKDKAREVGFANIEDLQAALLLPETVENIQRKKESIEKSIIEITSELKAKEDELNVLLGKRVTEKNIEELQLDKNGLLQEKESVAHLLVELKHQLKLNDELIKQFGQVKTQIESQEKEYAKWATLDQIIGSSKGDEFREFAQGLTLSHLLVKANQQLVKLNDRYLLKKIEDKALDLEVIDLYQANVTRPIHTLSGGESFLVSLSLALGLSDLASKNLSIDTLFIDEGFGTLDSETLDTALSTLENLRAKGKLVGIISHVDTLKERITTQVQVVKSASGVSKVIETY